MVISAKHPEFVLTTGFTFDRESLPEEVAEERVTVTDSVAVLLAVPVNVMEFQSFDGAASARAAVVSEYGVAEITSLFPRVLATMPGFPLIASVIPNPRTAVISASHV